MATFGYTRVSTVEQASGTSLEEQTRKIQGVAMMRGDEVSEVFTDRGVSGSVLLSQRPEGSKLIQRLGRGDTVIASKLDRMFRDAADALNQAKSFKDEGIDLIIADLGADPVTQNGASRMFFGILALMAEFERDRLRERQAEGQRAKKSKGGHIGGKRPFGFSVSGVGKNAILEPIPAEQEAIQKMKAMRASGDSYRSIAAWAIENGHEISHVTVKAVLERSEEDAQRIRREIAESSP